ncbi:MAG: hypothetical protein HQ510_03590 [Candidatus Marinimicrobia bacterium]|nr:hypothetical protein [Candidatus Neomarinimicrobiota bacterium]
MKSQITVLICIILLSQFTLGQETNNQKGRFAVQFGYSGHFDLTSFNGRAISAQYMLNDNKAIRLGITATGNNTSDDIIDYNYSGADDWETHYKDYTDYTGLFLNIECQIIHYRKSDSDLSLYYGFGPEFGYDYHKSKSKTLLSEGVVSHFENIAKLYVFGMGSVLGVEWKIKSNISVHAEYGNRLVYEIWDISSQAVTEGYSGNNERDTRDKALFFFSNKPVLVGVTFYLD